MSKPLLSLERISCRFGGLVALDQVSLEVEQGVILGLLGPNGAGKTTLLNVMSGLTPAQTGQVLWCGQSINALPSHAIARLGMARTFQNLRLFPTLSCRDNVLVGLHRHAAPSSIDGLIHRRSFRQREANLAAEASSWLERLELDHASDRPAGELSYGDRRRLEIARALASQPQLLLLDEPAAGMNPQEKDELCELIRRLRHELGLTIVIIEHHVPLMMQLCDRLVVLNFGKTIAEGTPAAIATDPAVIEAYLGGPP